MNPFTHSLLQRIRDSHLVEFVNRWDELEFLVIRVFKGKTASPADEREYQELRGWLLDDYASWQPGLDPYWRSAQINGQPVGEDPFTAVLQVQSAAGYVKNWPAMQTLPAAREALNNYLLDQIGD